MQWRAFVVCLALVVSCKGSEPPPAAAPTAAPAAAAESTAPTEPKATPLPDCARVDTTIPEVGKPEPWHAKARREPADPKLVAKVGDQGIPLAASEAILALKLEKYTSRKREPPQTALDRYRASLADRLVAHEILRQEAAALRIVDDAAALARRTAQQRVGIADWAKHLERRGETEESLRDMYVAELREVAIIEAEAPLQIGEPQLVAYYCRNRDDWKNDHEYRVISHLAFTSRDAASAAVTEIEGGAAMEKLAAKNPSVAFVDHDLVAPADNEFFKASFAAEVGRPTLVEIGPTFYALVVERSVPAGGLSRELLFDGLREKARQSEITKRRIELRPRLLAKYPVTLFGVPEAPEKPEPDAE